uniref:Uncharacterized protein n=1 Tax=Peronospora matthiolae TaxID=2874970 RepID=A0AAV1UYJ2_9STRA
MKWLRSRGAELGARLRATAFRGARSQPGTRRHDGLWVKLGKRHALDRMCARDDSSARQMGGRHDRVDVRGGRVVEPPGRRRDDSRWAGVR